MSTLIENADNSAKNLSQTTYHDCLSTPSTSINVESQDRQELVNFTEGTSSFNNSQQYQSTHERFSSFLKSTSDSISFLNLENVSIMAPNSDRKLISEVSFELRKGINVLIKGASGCGKTSIYRVIKELWPFACGRIDKNIDLNNCNLVMFLPQKPVFTSGSLRHQIIYPLEVRKFTETNFTQFIQLNKINNEIQLFSEINISKQRLRDIGRSQM